MLSYTSVQCCGLISGRMRSIVRSARTHNASAALAGCESPVIYGRNENAQYIKEGVHPWET